MAARVQVAGETIRVAAPAKINLYLGVRREIDAQGYHRVDTVMAALGLQDEVRISPSDGLALSCTPAVETPPEKNSAWRAAQALERTLEHEPRVHIQIEKRIPVAAGLGGPSTDAAAVLLGLCALWGVDAHDPRVLCAARSVGADVPFFLGGSPALLGGRGDLPVEEFALREAVPVVLVKPVRARVSTPAAYREFDARPQPAPQLEPLLEALRAKAGAAEFAPLIANNLGPAACALEPEIAQVLAWLRAQHGVLAASVCGSGACSFAICDDEPAAQAVAKAAASEADWWSCATSCPALGL